MSLLSGKTLFVTGGSGFIGGRLIETLCRDHDVKVRALVNRPFAGALRMARYPVDFVYDSITDTEAMTKALAGCDIVFHLAYGKSGSIKQQRQITIEGTRSLTEAAVANGVTRFVNVSTAAVYGNTIKGVIDESEPPKKWGWSYSDMKLEAEEVLWKCFKTHALPCTNLQVAGVYGPWGPVFTILPLTQLQTGRVGLVNEGRGVSNATFVDDVVQALVLGATRASAIGETFLIKGPGRVTRREFYEAYQNMIGGDSILLLKPADYKKLRQAESGAARRSILPNAIRALKDSKEFREALRASGLLGPLKYARKLIRSHPKDVAASSPYGGITASALDKRQIFLPPPFYATYLSAETEYSSKKAQTLLGYSPQYDLQRGMDVTEQWARWARIIPSNGDA
jgi:nucleoside-diphosphate-sugar epimerase